MGFEKRFVTMFKDESGELYSYEDGLYLKLKSNPKSNRIASIDETKTVVYFTRSRDTDLDKKWNAYSFPYVIFYVLPFLQRIYVEDETGLHSISPQLVRKVGSLGNAEYRLEGAVTNLHYFVKLERLKKVEKARFLVNQNK